MAVTVTLDADELRTAIDALVCSRDELRRQSAAAIKGKKWCGLTKREWIKLADSRENLRERLLAEYVRQNTETEEAFA